MKSWGCPLAFRPLASLTLTRIAIHSISLHLPSIGDRDIWHVMWLAVNSPHVAAEEPWKLPTVSCSDPIAVAAITLAFLDLELPLGGPGVAVTGNLARHVDLLSIEVEKPSEDDEVVNVENVNVKRETRR